MRKMFGLLVVLSLATMASAAAMIVDDFNSYADDASLQAAWVPQTGGLAVTETLSTYNGSPAMLFQIAGGSPYWSQVMYSVPGAVWQVHGVNLIYPGFNAVKLDFSIPSSTVMGGTGGLFYITFFDCWGQAVLSANVDNGGGVTKSGTSMTWEIPFATATVSGMNLENVARIALGYKNCYYQAGAVYVDNIQLVPEPVTCSLLALGALAALRRR